VGRETKSTILLAALVFMAQGCGADRDSASESESPASRPVLLIGLDGATWDLIDPWILRGELPNLGQLRREGAWGVLQSFDSPSSHDGGGTLSPVIWTTIATGRRPQDHGILGFTKPGPDRSPYTNLDRRVRALWNILSDRGRSVDVVGWFNSWPVDVVNGHMISDHSDGIVDGGHFPADLEPLLGRTAAELPLDEVRRQLDSFLGPSLDLSQAGWEKRSRARDLEQTLEDTYRVDRLRWTWTAELMSQRPADLTAVFFKGIDAVSHKAWLYMDPQLFDPRFRPPEAERRRFEEVIARYYAFMDAAIGALLDAAPRETNVVIVSDHGFGPCPDQPGDATYSVNAVLAQLGWVISAEDASVDPERSLVVDPAEPWEAVHRDRTLWVNGQRLFAAADDPERRAAKLQDLADRLSSIETVEGLELFESVKVEAHDETCIAQGRSCGLRVRVAAPMEDLARIIDGEGAADTHRYLVLGREFPLDRFLGLRIGQSGTHRLQGIIVMAGPDVSRGAELRDATVYDVAPTVLRLLDLPPAENMPGRVLDEALRRDALPAIGSRVATYERHDPLDRVAIDLAVDVDRERERTLDQLRALGYIN
jgi:predicted AlkP superfamily phosphohydrolase/phosphomutase